MKQTIPFSFMLNVQDIPTPIPAGIVPAFPISTTHPDWPLYLNRAKLLGNSNLSPIAVLFAWAADGRTNNAMRDWCIGQFRATLAAMLTKWNAGADVTEFSFDSYLSAGDKMAFLATCASWTRAQLTAQELSDFDKIAQQAVWNIWNAAKANWNGMPRPWSSWATNSPLNNYFIRSFLRATVYYAIFAQSQVWTDYLRTVLAPMVSAAYAPMVGGGSLEGTSYGQHYWELFHDIWLMRQGLGIDIVDAVNVAPNIDYWISAVTLDYTRFHPFGDQAGSPVPRRNDAITSLIQWAIMLCPNTPQAARGRDWLKRAGNRAIQYQNYWMTCYDTPGPTAAQVGKSYAAEPVGHLFAWDAPSGLSLSFSKGNNIQSHAGMEAMTLQLALAGTFLTAGNKIASKSGLMQQVQNQNVPLFRKADGTIISPKRTDANTMTMTDDGTVMIATVDASPCYAGTDVSNCFRTVTLDRPGRQCTVQDRFTLASGVKVSQRWNVFTAPVVNVGGSVAAGGLTLSCDVPLAQPPQDWNTLNAAEFPTAGKCWLVEFGDASGYTTVLRW